MSNNDDYEYDDDDEYYEDDEEYVDYDEDDTLSSRLGDSVKPYSSNKRGSGLPGGASSGSRFGGSSGGSSGSTSRFGGSSRFNRSNDDDDDDEDEETSSRFKGTNSKRFGGTSGGSSGGSSRFGGTSGGSSGSSSRFGNKKDDTKKGGTSSSRFGGTSGGSSGSSSRFGNKKDDAKKGGTSSSRFGSKKDNTKKGGTSSSRFGSQKAATKDKTDDKQDGGGGIGGLVGGFRNRLGGGGNKEEGDKSEGGGGGIGGLVGGFAGRFGGKKDDAAKDDSKPSGGAGRFGGKKDNTKSTSGSSRLGSSSGGSSRFGKKDDAKSTTGTSRFGASGGSSRFGKKDDAKSTTGTSRFGKKTTDKKEDSKAAKGSRFGSFGRGKKDDDKKAADKKGSSKKPSPFGKKSGKVAAASASAEASGVRGRLTSAVGGFFTGGRAGEEASTKAPVRRVPKASDDGLTLDNWLDIIGVGMVFFSLIMFFSAISQEQAAIGALHTFTGQLFGWGALAAPVTLFLVGMWLIVRHFGEQAPTVDPIRVVGVVIIYISVLVIFQYFDALSYEPTEPILSFADLQSFLGTELEIAWRVRQAGGGIVGAQIYFVLVTTFTEIGGFLLIIFAILIGSMLITRMSAAEIVRAGGGIWLSFREYTKHRAVRKRAERQLAAQQAAQEQAGILGGQQLQSQAAFAAQTDPQATGREIRMNVGGQAQTIAMQAGAQAMPQQYPAQQAMQSAPQNNNGGIFGRFRGSQPEANNSGFSIFGRGNNGSPTSSPPAPVKLPDAPLPMDDGFSHFDTGPMKSVKSDAQPRLGDMLRAGGQQAPPPPMMPKAEPAQAPPPPQQAAASVGENLAEEEQEVNNFLKQRQDRLNALRQGEVGPLSQGALARAREEDVSAAFVPSSEGQRDEQYGKFQTGLGAAAKAAQTSDGSSNEFTPPSQLPSVQREGDNEPHQQMLAVGVDKPVSNTAKSSREKTNWRLPDYSTLLSSGGDQEFDREYLLKQAKIIEETLESFSAPGRVVEVNTGPVITQFGVEPDYVQGRSGRKQRVKVSSIATLDKDLQLALGARSIRIEAPVPGKGYVGIEVPNAESALVSLRDVMDSQSFAKYNSPLTIALGQSVSGAPISADLATMPHLLIAGTTGSGKSVCVNSIIASILAFNTPDEVKFIMVDPKRVELTGYNGIPHLVAPVVVELERIVGVLKWVTREMDARYKQFSEAGARNIEDFNKHRNPETTDRMSYLVVIIDELADLMMLAPEETERTITRIAALARATGIHLVIATQRPSVDVVTGLIKANFPARIAFAVAGSVDSRVILDQPGAERLLGKGDMLWMSGDSPAPLRLQGVFLSDMEINNIVRYWKMQALQQPSNMPSTTSTLAPKFSIEESKPKPRANASGGKEAFWDNGGEADDLPLFAAAKRNAEAGDVSLTQSELTGDAGDGNEDDLYERSVELVRRLDKASISLLQRRLRIGYTRAARLIDVMEARGIVGPAKDGSSKPRDVLPER